MIVKKSAASALISPDGISLMNVLGFFASIFLSAHLLKAMAAVRAKTIHSNTFKARAQEKKSGRDFMASEKPMNAKGKANTVCENFTKER